MITYNLSTDLIPSDYTPDTYWEYAVYNSEYIFESDLLHLAAANDKYPDQFWENFNLDKWKQDVATHYKECVLPYIQDDIADEIPSAVLTLTSDKLISPRYYNYGTDWLLFDLQVEQSELLHYITNEMNTAKCDMRLRDNYSTCAGFISLTPNSIKWLRRSIQTEDTEKDNAVWAVLSFILKDKSSWYIQENLQTYLGNVCDYIDDPVLKKTFDDAIEKEIQ
jgi:hypothetical protein